jgi:crotonobetainyl-CoA:carnitine CoA-transferase CaiB-like acyl-CoA transferase
VDVSLYETALGLLPYQITRYLGTGEISRRHGTAFPLIVPYQVFATRDGELMIAAANDRLFAALCEALELPELAADPRFATNPERLGRREELTRLLGARLLERDSAAWLERLERAGVPVSPVLDVGQVAEHPQTRALGILQELAGRRTVALPLSADGERVRHRSPPPLLGEHTAQVLSEAGYSRAEIAALAESEVIRLGGAS